MVAGLVGHHVVVPRAKVVEDEMRVGARRQQRAALACRPCKTYINYPSPNSSPVRKGPARDGRAVALASATSCIPYKPVSE